MSRFIVWLDKKRWPLLFGAYWFGIFMANATPLQSRIVTAVSVLLIVLLWFDTWRMKRKIKERDKAEKPQPKSVSQITVKQMALVEQIGDDKNPARARALIELWESIYGQTADYTRPFADIVAEVSVALTEMAS